jgi:hypothetical protein
MGGAPAIICESALYAAWRALVDAQHAAGERDEAQTLAALERLLDEARKARAALVGL